MASELHVDAIKHSGGTTALEIDSSGRVLTPARPAFKARRLGGSNQSLGGGSDTQTLIMNVVDFDIGGGYNTSTGIYTVPKTGIYFFFLNPRFDSMDASSYFRAIIYNGSSSGQATAYTDLGNVLTSINGDGHSSNYETRSVSGILQCTQGDTIRFLGGHNSDTSVTLQQESQCGGFLVG